MTKIILWLTGVAFVGWVGWTVFVFVAFPNIPMFVPWGCIDHDPELIGICRNVRFADANLGFIPLLVMCAVMKISATLKRLRRAEGDQ
jgi:hypothetical protein